MNDSLRYFVRDLDDQKSVRKKINRKHYKKDIICKNILVCKKSIPNYVIVEVAGRITHFHSLSFIYHDCTPSQAKAIFCIPSEHTVLCSQKV